MRSQQIVVTGCGGICCLGADASKIWDAMRAGTSGIRPLSQEPGFNTRIPTGGVVFELPEQGLSNRRASQMGRFSVLAIIAARDAWQNARLDSDDVDRTRIGTSFGVAVYGSDAVEHSYRSMFLDGKKSPGAFTVPSVMPSAPAGNISIELGLMGPVFSVSSACSSSNHAIIAAADQIAAGRADVMIAGGSDTPISYGVLKAWEALRVVSRDTCRPFSVERDGLVLGEGAGALVLESLSHARSRGAPILAEFIGGGLSADASDIVSPTRLGPESAIRSCLQESGINPGDVDYLNAHGSGTKQNDLIEAETIRAVFGAGADLSVSATKSMHAHCLGASGAIEAIACLGAIRDGIIPPTANFIGPDPDCNLDVTPNVAVERKVDVAISNSFAFGGMNAVVAFGRHER